MSSGSIPLIELRGIEKLFPGVKALSEMSFSVKPGSVHVLCGENGAGKSTLCKIINGVYQPDRGTILVNGRPTVMRDPLAARSRRARPARRGDRKLRARHHADARGVHAGLCAEQV